MELRANSPQPFSPFLQLLLLGCLALAGLFIGVIVGFIVALACYGTVLLHDLTWLNGSNPTLFGAVKIILVAQQLGLFLMPALLLPKVVNQKSISFFEFKDFKLGFLIMTILLMICSIPIMSGLNELNQSMVFPDFLKDIEIWMRQMEDEALKTTEAILTMRNVGDFVIALLVIALVPAICEEYFFRGAIQGIFLKGIRNPHAAIWLGAIVFSSIHFQFYGFVPRLILGGLFGYLYYWTKNLWYPIVAHFLNNAFAVCFAWYYQQQKLPLNTDEELPVAWYGYLISLVLTLALLKYLKDTAQQKDDV